MYFFLKGPMETIHLNAFGTKKYCETYGETIYNVSKDMGPIPEAWLMKTDEDKAKVTTFLKVYQINLEKSEKKSFSFPIFFLFGRLKKLIKK